MVAEAAVACVCVCGSAAAGGGALSVITISDWVRAKVCDISKPSTTRRRC